MTYTTHLLRRGREPIAEAVFAILQGGDAFIFDVILRLHCCPGVLVAGLNASAFLA